MSEHFLGSNKAFEIFANHGLELMPRALSEGNPRYKMARTISDIMLVWMVQAT